MRKVWIGLIALFAVGLFGVAAAVAAFYLYPRYRMQQDLATAEEAYSAELWLPAKINYAWYLTRSADDVAVLSKYAEVSLLILRNRRSNLHDAGRAYYRMAQLNPGDEKSQQRVLDFYERYEFWPDLQYSAKEFMRTRPDDLDLKYFIALALERQGRTNSAVAAYQELVDLGTENRDVYGNLARLILGQDLPGRAEALLDKAIAMYPDDAHILSQRALFFLEAGRLAEAEREIQTSLEKHGGDLDGLKAAAQVALAKREWDKAIEFAEKALALAPDDLRSIQASMYAFQARGDTDRVISFLQDLDPVLRIDYPDLLLLLAEAQFAEELADDGNATAEQYRTSYPENVLISEYLVARESLARGMYQEAANKLRTVIEAAPEFARAKYFQVVAYLQAGQNDQARGALESYLEDRPDDVQARQLFDTVLAGPRTHEQARATAQELFDSKETAPDTMIAAAQSLSGAASEKTLAEDGALIVQLLERAIDRDTSAPEGYIALATHFVGRGDTDAARDILIRAKEAHVPAGSLLAVDAAIVLADGDVDAAYSKYVMDLDRANIADTEILRWATLFAKEGHLESGIDAITLAVKRSDAGNIELEVEKVALCVEFGNLAKALTLEQSLDFRVSENPVALRRLNVLRLSLAGALARPGPESDLEKAHELVDVVKRLDPDNTMVWAVRARFFLAQEPPDYGGAQGIALASLEADPSDTNALLILYECARATDRSSLALDLAKQAYSTAPQDARAQYALASAYIQMGENRNAQEILDIILLTYPNEPRATALSAQSYAAAGQFQQSDELLHVLTGLEAVDLIQANLLISTRASIFMNRGDWASAEKLLRTQQETNPDDFATARSLARAIGNQGRLDEAKAMLSRFSEKPSAWCSLAQIYLTAGKEPSLVKASSAFTRALVLEADYPPALRGMIEIQLIANNAGSALAFCERYLTEQPNDVEILKQKALLLSQSPNSLQESLDTITHAIDLIQRPEFFSIRGFLYLSIAKYDRAIQDIQRFADTQGVTTAEIDAALAEAHFGLDGRDLATQYYRSAKRKAAAGEPVNRMRMRRIEKLLTADAAA